MKELSVPIHFELGEELEDDRFLKVKIFIAHTGENLNNSYFSKQMLETMAPTLSHIPIVGYIESDEKGNEDFKGHETVIKVKDGDVDVYYAGHAYGFVPQENNYGFELRGGKEWLTCEGIIWTKFRDSISIFLDGNGVKSQSMEISVSESFIDEQGRVNYTEAKFEGLCILGDNVPPAMKGSTIEIFSSKTHFFSQIQEMISEFYQKEDGNLESKEHKEVESEAFEDEQANVEDTREEAVDAEESELKEPKDEEVKDEAEEVELSEENSEDSENEEVNSDEEESESEVEAEAEFEEESKDGDKTKVLSNEEFALSHEELRRNLMNTIREFEEDADWAWIIQTFDDTVVAQVEMWDDDTESVIKMYDYSKDGDEITLSNGREVTAMYLTKSEVEQVEAQREEIKSLREQLSVYELADKEEKVAEYAEILGDKADEIRAKFSELSIEEVEKEVAFAYFQLTKEDVKSSKPTVNAVNFSRKKPNESAKAVQEYGEELGSYFTRNFE